MFKSTAVSMQILRTFSSSYTGGSYLQDETQSRAAGCNTANHDSQCVFSSLGLGMAYRNPRVRTDGCSHHVAGQQGEKAMFVELSV